METPLKALNEKIDFESFRDLLEECFKTEKENKGQGGRPPYDIMVHFKTILIAELYNLSDDATEFLINDRRTFRAVHWDS